MIEFMPRSHDDVLAIKVGGSLSAADYETKLIPKLDELLSRHKVIVVGGPPWVRWCMAASAFLMPGEIRSFPADRLEEAWQWAEAEGR
jgi:tRNA A37 N6-isopentenylltransferase MiaA